MTALCSGKICTIFPEKGALNLWKACTIALEYSIMKSAHDTCDYSYRRFDIKNGQYTVRATSSDNTAVPKGQGITRGAAYFAKEGDCS